MQSDEKEKGISLCYHFLGVLGTDQNV